MMTYKKYTGTVTFDDEAEIFHGEVVGLRDVVTFQGSSVSELKQAFRDSVDDYLAFCQERGEEPEKPVSGKFLIRIKPELHRRLIIEAAREGMSLNQLAEHRLEVA